mmetsp:Transcript_45133/g.111933  ORF Transcript_45133/g.111933 Transcript_45133/m.111933 type:complete len:216 (+) Transcript_45133:1107-1754(+)
MRCAAPARAYLLLLLCSGAHPLRPRRWIEPQLPRAGLRVQPVHAPHVRGLLGRAYRHREGRVLGGPRAATATQTHPRRGRRRCRGGRCRRRRGQEAKMQCVRCRRNRDIRVQGALGGQLPDAPERRAPRGPPGAPSQSHRSCCYASACRDYGRHRLPAGSSGATSGDARQRRRPAARHLGRQGIGGRKNPGAARDRSHDWGQAPSVARRREPALD